MSPSLDSVASPGSEKVLLFASEKVPLLKMDSEATGNESGEEKGIRLLSCISVALSMMMGVGIFIFPNMVLNEVNSGGASLIMWMIGGVVAMLGGLCYSELATAVPGSGGELVYIQKTFGAVPANLFVLTSAFVKYPAVSIIMTRSCFTYFIKIFVREACFTCSPYNYLLVFAGICITVFVCVLASISTRLCTSILNALNFFKFAGFAMIISFAIYVVARTPDKSEIASRFSMDNTTTDGVTLLISVFGSIASYEGWNSLNLVAGEVHNPQKTMPAAIIIATAIATVFYLLLNMAYLAVLPLDLMKSSNAVAMDLGRIAFGRFGEVFLSVCVVCSCFATILALVLCNSRLLQRAAQEGQVPRVFGLCYTRTRTPVLAIALHGLVCCVFATITSLEFLTTICIIVSWLFYLLCFLAQLVLRYRHHIVPSFRVPAPVPLFLTLFSILLILAPVTTPAGIYRLSFLVTAGVVLLLTPVSVLATLPALRTWRGPFVERSQRLNNWVESFGCFE